MKGNTKTANIKHKVVESECSGFAPADTSGNNFRGGGGLTIAENTKVAGLWNQKKSENYHSRCSIAGQTPPNKLPQKLLV